MAESIGERVRKIRTRKGIGRPELARAAEMSYSSLADLENGYQKSTTKLHKLADALGVSVHHLEHGGPENPPARTQSLSEREFALVQAFRGASLDGKRAIEGAAAGVTAPPEPSGQKRRSA